jgi:hypothetical protein
VKEIDVRFDDGRDLLNAYWGYLSDGGLVIDDHDGLDVGQAVSLRVHIASSGSKYLIAGTVRRQTLGRQLVIAFRPGEPHDMLLTEALAETENVPARRHRRFRLVLPARVRKSGAEPVTARLVNVSHQGCCFEVEDALRTSFAVGSRVEIEAPEQAPELRVGGEVVWVRNTERGVRFDDAPEGGVLEVLKDHIKLG